MPPRTRGKGSLRYGVPVPKVTLRDVADAAQVHPATASRALNDPIRGAVSPKTVKRVTEAAGRLGYQPNSFARALRTRQSFLIGVLIPDITGALLPPIIRGVEDELTVSGYTALILNTDNDLDRERRQFEMVRSRQADGFILATARRVHPLLTDATAQGVPLVLVNRVPDQPLASSVCVDDTAGIMAAVDHLVGLGHTNIVHIAGPQNLSNGYGRAQAFRSALANHGLPVPASSIVQADSFTFEEGERAAATLIGQGVPCTAVVAANDLLAIGVIAALGRDGHRCPQDVSVVGFNDMSLADKLSPALTTIRVPSYEMGAEAARLLLDRLERPNGTNKSLLLRPELIVRDSSAPPARHRHK
jgi:LacI family transcriptional regulator